MLPLCRLVVSLPVSRHLRQEKSKAPWLLFPSPPRQRRWVSMSWPTFKCWGLEYPQNGLAVTRGLIGSKPELVRNLTKAFVEAIAYFKTHKNETLAIYQKYLKTDDMDALKETYETVGLNLISEKPYPTIKGIQIVLRQLASKDPKPRGSKRSNLWIPLFSRSWISPALYAGSTSL